MNLIQVSVIKDGSTVYATAQPRAIDAKNIKLAYPVANLIQNAIVDVSLTLNTIAVAGDKTSFYTKGKSIDIKLDTNTTTNNGTYTIKNGSTYSGGNTIINLTETLPSSTAAGVSEIDTEATEILYYSSSKALVDVLTVEEKTADIFINTTVLFQATTVSIDGVAFAKSVLLNGDSIYAAINNTAGAMVSYDMGYPNQRKDIQVSDTVEEIQTAIEAAEDQTPATTPQNYNIVDINATLNTFAIEGNHAAEFVDADTFTVVGGANAGSFTVSGDSAFDGVNTVITVTANITVDTVGGYIHK